MANPEHPAIQAETFHSHPAAFLVISYVDQAELEIALVSPECPSPESQFLSSQYTSIAEELTNKQARLHQLIDLGADPTLPILSDLAQDITFLTHKLNLLQGKTISPLLLTRKDNQIISWEPTDFKDDCETAFWEAILSSFESAQSYSWIIDEFPEATEYVSLFFHYRYTIAYHTDANQRDRAASQLADFLRSYELFLNHYPDTEEREIIMAPVFRAISQSLSRPNP